MCRFIFSLAFLCSCLFLNRLQADLVIGVGSQDGLGNKQTFVGGTRATMWVHASDSTAASPINLDTYSLAFQIGNTATIPVVFANFSVDFTGGLISNSPPTGFGLELDPTKIQADAVPGHNIIVSNDRGAGNGLVVPGAPLPPSRLFSISFDIAANADGVFQLRFVPDAKQFGGDVNQALGQGLPEGFGATANSGSTFFNQFTVTAVPEPSSFLLGGLALGWIGWRNRRKHLCRKKDRVMAM